jgi:Flp pilus assembly protein CpaB
MKSRSLVVAGALILALLATAGVFLYVSNVKEEAETGGALTTVLVSTTDIPAGTDLDSLADQGAFTPEQFPSDSVVQGAVTSVGQLRGRAAAVPILAGEQIALSRLSGTQEKLPGGVFGLQEGYEAVAVRLTAEQMLGENLQTGDHVTFFAHFTELGGSGALDDQTAVVVPDARVLDVTTPVADADATTTESDEVIAEQLVTLELTQEQGQQLVFAQNSGEVWLGLIRPGDRAPSEGPIDVSKILGKVEGS